MRIQGKNAQGAVRMMRLARVCIKGAPQTGNTVLFDYLFDYGNTENINLNILLGCFVVQMS